MYKLILSNEHKEILKKAFQSYFLIRQNKWDEFIHDIEPINKDCINGFSEAYKVASPDYEKLYKIIRDEKGEIVDVVGFSETIKTVFLKVIKNELLFHSVSELKSLLYVVEEYMRMRIGQFFIFCDDVAHNGWKYDSTKPHNSIAFDDYIERKERSNVMFNFAYKKAISHVKYKSKNVLIAEDLYDVLKHRIYLDTPEAHNNCWAIPPLSWSGLPLPEIEVL